MQKDFLKIKILGNITYIMIILLLSFLLRLPFLLQPLDRDAGVFALIGYTQNQGYIDYKDHIDNKPPGTHFIFSLLFKFFQPTDITVNFFVICWGVLNTFLVYFLSRALFNNFSVTHLATILYAFFSSSPFIEGNIAAVENFMVTFNMLGFYFLIKAEERKSLWLFLIFGLFFGIAFMFKQIAILDYFATLIYLLIILLFKEQKLITFLKKITISTLAFIIPLLIAIIYFNYKGALNDFIFQCFTYNFKYIKLCNSGGNYWGKFIYFNLNMFKTNSIVWIGTITFIIFLLVSLFAGKTLNKEFFKENRKKFLLALWGVFSFISLCSSSRFFPHYYIAILPSFSLATAFILSYLLRDFHKKIVHIFILVCIILSISISVYFHYDYYLKFSPQEISMHQYVWEPFVEAKEVGLYIREHTKPDDYIFVWAEEPEIHFYSLRNSVCRYWSNVPFIYFRMIYNDAEDVLFSAMKRNPPKYIIIDTRHEAAMNYYKNIKDIFQKNYILEKEFKVIRNNVWGYSLLAYHLKYN